LKSEGFIKFRVRCHENLARIEFDEDEIDKAFDKKIRAKIDTKFKEIGFRYIAIDISGYKKGNMN
jgi:pyridinium-3,5-biscarboxylic acid mononucleotide sulfurtransferase